MLRGQRLAMAQDSQEALQVELDQQLQQLNLIIPQHNIYHLKLHFKTRN